MEVEVIPGLPDAVALECLIRLPFSFLRIARRVCKRWRHEISSSSFYRLRKAANVARLLAAFVVSNPKHPFEKWVALYDVTEQVWTRLPMIRDSAAECQVVAVGHELVVIGRRHSPTNMVHVHNLLTGVWRLGAPMPGPRRAFFACAASAESPVVFVAGGRDQQGLALRSALAYDVETDAWAPLPDMARPVRKCRGFFARGLFRVFSRQLTFEAFDATAGEWKTRRLVSHRRTEVAAPEEEVQEERVPTAAEEERVSSTCYLRALEHAHDRVLVLIIARSRGGIIDYFLGKLKERLQRVKWPTPYGFEEQRFVASLRKSDGFCNVESLCYFYF
ncbi:F-box/kelch-repeat protein At1g80440-like [Zingiber officinale]|uniref:F-box/kelch-repeat protein At1g80440-like n=1 Tax=Zingiber officinale TaxID=94328 RepID=UPI001C4DA801|nr:F-box/kelch-repeat protein At1g80440-like [Zingiber officinale]